MADWANLPIDLLICIAERLNILEDFISIDFIRFCAVCKSWQLVKSSIGTKLTLPREPQYPYVMLTDIAEKNFPKTTNELLPGDMLVIEVKKNEQIEGMHKRRFYSLSTCKTYEIELPQATRRKCLGVGFGWLLTIGYDLKINLLHPFTRKQIGMPNYMSFKWDWSDERFFEPPDYGVYFFVHKAVMSSNPLLLSSSSSYQEDCIILVIYSPCGILGFARPGDKTWTHLNSERHYKDVIYFNGNFYAVDCYGQVYICDIRDQNNLKVTKITCTPTGNAASQKYLVESSGSLFVVARHLGHGEEDSDNSDQEEVLDSDEEDTDNSDQEEVLDSDEEDIDNADQEEVLDSDEENDIDDLDHTYNTVGFSIYKMVEEDFHGDDERSVYPYKLKKIDNLGDQSLFLGNNASTSLSSSKCIKPNCIYFSEDCTEYYDRQYGGGHDTGIYDVESKTTTSHFAAGFRSHLTPPLWLI